MSDSYSSLAPFYDRLNGGTDYDAICTFVRELFESEQKPIRSVLDLACGTGNLTVPLARAGYDMTGIDLSEEMLSLAQSKADGLPILFVKQNMVSFELYGTVDAVICCLDSLNYLLKKEELERTFAHVKNYLEPGGLFVFDVNTPYRLEQVYGRQDFVLEEEGILCTWRNDYNERTRICTFYLSLFEEQTDGSYLRSDEEQKERAYAFSTFKKLIGDNGMELVSVYGAYDRSPVTEDSEKWCFVCRRTAE
ncbi:MAG: class I SAM-dependent methyltransferase [Ruminococcaceae bacterium]|nr:class I SAM-dependent methyltransferase [Oscillospiraceae bacterium]